MPDPLLRLLACFTLLFALASCSSSSEEKLPVNVIDFTDAGTGGSCIQPSFPSDQPDLPLFNPPYFLITDQQSTTGQATERFFRDGSGVPLPMEIEAQIRVNSPTRLVRLELTSVWDSRSVLATEDIQTNGNETLQVLIDVAQPSRGRYYMRLTMCGADCDAQQVLFEAQSCDGLPDSQCAHNVPYVRSVIEDNEIVRTDSTCIDLGSDTGPVRNSGSGTVLIQ